MENSVDWSGLLAPLTCQVCKDIFQDPQVLSCHHTLCRKCAISLNSSDRISCPQCQADTNAQDIIADVRTLSLVEWYCQQKQSCGKSNENKLDLKNMPHQTEVENKTSGGSIEDEVCILCEVHPATVFCWECQRMLCVACQRSHIKLGSCKEESSLPIEASSKKYKAVLTEHLQLVKTQLTNLETGLKAVRAANTKEWAGTIVAIEQAEKSILEKVQQFFRAQKEDMNVHMKESEDHAKTTYERHRKGLNSLLGVIQELLTSGNNQLLSHFQPVMRAVTQQISLSQSVAFPKLAFEFSKDTSNCSVAFHELDAPNVKVKKIKLLTSKMQATAVMDMNELIYKLLWLGQELWCFSSTGISIRDAVGGCVTNLQTSLTSWGATADGQDVIVASTKSSLLQISPNSGDHTCACIQEGSYHSVVKQGEKLLALREEENKDVYIDEFEKQGNAYRRVTETPISGLEGDGHSCPLTMATVNNTLYICSCTRNRIVQLNSHSEVVQTFGTYGTNYPGELNNPWLCCSDTSGCMLVADSNNGRLQVLDPGADNQWSVITFGGQVTFPRAALIDAAGRLYCSDCSNNTLYICM